MMQRAEAQPGPFQIPDWLCVSSVHSLLKAAALAIYVGASIRKLDDREI